MGDRLKRRRVVSNPIRSLVSTGTDGCGHVASTSVELLQEVQYSGPEGEGGHRVENPCFLSPKVTHDNRGYITCLAITLQLQL